ncbi:MAG: hypothetical protein IPN33_06880 [Saprospiraceae bacterium]|nr:hypothetical protein [Saprospiraceae bacterium]
MLIQEVIENSPGANHLAGGIIRAVDCGLGGLAEGVFKEGTIRLFEQHKNPFSFRSNNWNFSR